MHLLNTNHELFVALCGMVKGDEPGRNEMGSFAEVQEQPMVLADYWPLFQLRLTTPRLTMAPLTDPDMVDLLAVILGGIHPPDQMPFVAPWTQAPRAELIPNTLQFLWKQRVELAPQKWTILFGVRHEGRMVGLQEVSASSFAVRRTVETGSYLGIPFQGRGFGTEMRAAVAQFAFDHLLAERAESAAFLDNPTSQRVSAKLGYLPNGQQLLERREGERVLSQELVLTPVTFVRPAWELQVEGLAACRAELGLNQP